MATSNSAEQPVRAWVVPTPPAEPVTVKVRAPKAERHAGTEEYAGMVKRMLKAYPKKIRTQEADVSALGQLAEIQRELDDRIQEVVMELRRQDVSWAQIADSLGMARGAAYNRFIKRAGVEDPSNRKVGGQPAALR